MAFNSDVTNIKSESLPFSGDFLLHSTGPQSTSSGEIERIGFVHAVIHWLAEFPQSPYTINSSIEQFVNPRNLFQIICILLGSKYVYGVVDMKEELKPELLKVEELFGRSGSVVTDADNIIIPKHLLQQVKLMEGVVKNHFMNFGFVEKKQHNLDKVDWYQACLFYNMTEILKLAELILEIGTYSSRDQSTFGLTAIKFLMEEDRKILQEHLIQQPYYGAERLLESHPPVSYASSSVTPLKIYDGEYEDSFKLKSFNLKSTQVADHFIEEDYLLSLKWENSFLEEVVYELATQLKEEDNKLHS